MRPNCRNLTAGCAIHRRYHQRTRSHCEPELHPLDRTLDYVILSDGGGVERFKLGRQGFLQKTASSEEIVGAVLTVAAGGTAFPDIASGGSIEALSMRECEVLQLMVAGCRNADIAEELHISLRTTEYHVSNVLSKLEARSRADAVRIAHAHGILVE